MPCSPTAEPTTTSTNAAVASIIDVARPGARAASQWALVAALLLAALVALPAAPGDAEEPEHQITLPVDPAHLDRVRWTDTWGAPRSGGRSHIGVDMMGPRMVPLVAAADSEVTWGRFDNDRGTIVRLRDAAGWEYQYIHINNDTPGTDDGRATCSQALAAKLCDSLDGDRLQSGIRFEAGEFIGYLGDSGNAEWTAPHLHFEIYRPDGEDLPAVNPTPFVDAARVRAERVAVDPVGPYANPAVAADEIYRRLEGRIAGSEERTGVTSAAGRGGYAAILAQVAEGNPSAAMVDRLYLAFFQRPPDGGGWDHWIDARSDGHRLEDIAEWFAESDEFVARYGSGDFSAFLDLLYRDVLGREPDQDGKTYWLGQLEAGAVNRGTIVVYFTESTEMRTLAQWRSELTIIRRALGQSRPSDAEVEAWRVLRTGTDLETAIADLVGPSG
ncbi:MAG: DUF4214 domain-containing protein [Actinomycetota bacterium]